MSNVFNFPSSFPVEVIDEPNFEKHNDAALLLKCFEVVQSTLDAINEPECHIEKEDDTHVDLIRAFYALKVLFKRKTGHDAMQVAHDHFEALRRHLLEGAPPPDNRIPVVVSPVECLPDEAFDGFTEQQLACAAFNYSARVQALIMDHSPQALAVDEARTFSIDATTALRLLVLRLSGGSVETMRAGMCRKPGETLQ